MLKILVLDIIIILIVEMGRKNSESEHEEDFEDEEEVFFISFRLISKNRSNKKSRD